MNKPYILIGIGGFLLLTQAPHSSAAVLSQDGLQIQNEFSLSNFVSVSNEEEVYMGARNFIQAMSERAIVFLADKDASEDVKKTSFKKLLNESFDTETIGRFALGRYWRDADKNQRKEYLGLFNKMIVDVYTERFKDYDGQNLEVKEATPIGKADILVKSNIVQKTGAPVQVDWRLRYKNSQYKIIDVIVEGVSMGVTQRSDFSSVIQKGGGDISVLIDHLKN